MSQIESYLKRAWAESDMSYNEDFYDMYSFAQDNYLRLFLASFHTNLNRLMAIINYDIRTTYDEEGKIVYSGGYFHAQDSRDYLALLEKIDALRSKLKLSKYEFRICKAEYDDFIEKTRRFVVKSGGSTIPEGFEPIEIEDLNPVFELVSGIEITNENKKIYMSIKLVGEGSYAKVFSYRDPNYNIPIILKRALKSLDDKEIKRFEQEFLTLKSLYSPVTIHGWDK